MEFTTPEQHLAWFFKRHGQVRFQDAERFKAEGWKKYKKGFEIRLTGLSEEDLAEVRNLLEQAGFKLARPFRHTRYHYVQPIYGKVEVERFLAFLPKSVREKKLPNASDLQRNQLQQPNS
jgi:hypothetical protein